MKLCGNSPEICRALDSHGFADLKAAMAYHCALSSTYPIGDYRRFCMGTPTQVWSTMIRCWELEPTSERIKEDILAFPRVLDKIIAYKGCVVPDECLRHGKRWARLDKKGDCKKKPRASQRKSMMKGRVTHRDCAAALLSLENKEAEAVDRDATGVDLLTQLLEGRMVMVEEIMNRDDFDFEEMRENDEMADEREEADERAEDRDAALALLSIH